MFAWHAHVREIAMCRRRANLQPSRAAVFLQSRTLVQLPHAKSEHYEGFVSLHYETSRFRQRP